MALSLLSDGATDMLPVTTSIKRSRLPARRRVLTFLATAALSGILFQLCVAALSARHVGNISRQWWKLEDFGEGMHMATSSSPSHLDKSQEVLSEANISQAGWRPREGKDDMDLDQLREMVGHTKGYFARDWSVGLGWNNMRYIIEAALLQSTILNRTLVIPSFVYARACEFPGEICSAYALQVDREGVSGWDKWNGAVLSTLAWHIPIEIMLDLPHLRRTHSVVLVSEFLELQGLDPTVESLAGDWDRLGYHEGPLGPTLHVIPNNEYDPAGVLRVDRLMGSFGEKEAESKVNVVLEERLGTRQVYEAGEARDVLKEAGLGDAELDTDEGLEEVLKQGGWAPLHTFQPVGGTEFAKMVVEPAKQIASLSRCRGFLEDYGDIAADVILLEGETHLERKPGQMRFTSVEAREEFARTVLHSIRPIERVRTLADRITERLCEIVGGRMWLSAHMRRGDFVTVGFVHSKSLQDHFAKIKAAVERGRQTLLEMEGEQPFDVPDASVEIPDLELEMPEEHQPFYLATDERSSEGMQYLRDNGAILIGDILTVEDRRLIGWPLLLTDVLALVEQAVLARSSYFIGYSMSSVSGGVFNMRAARGADARTSVIDWS